MELPKPSILLNIAFLLTLTLMGQSRAVSVGDTAATALRKVAANESNAPFLINNVFSYYTNSGSGCYNKYRGDNEGFEWPKGSGSTQLFGKTLVFEEGIVWVGHHRGEVQAGGSTYWTGMQAGRIVTPGTASTRPVASDPSGASNRVYRVRPDINPATSFDAVKTKIHNEETVLIDRYTAASDQQIYDRYIADWKEWPAAEGAPFEDKNGNGMYDWQTDVPGKPGADQTLWYVANDLDSLRAANFVGAAQTTPLPRPIGLEMQKTIWGYRGAGWLDNAIFESTVLINKGGFPVDSMYIAQWADPDLGYPSDDRVGCDTCQQMAYAYNGGSYDDFYGAAPPAFGSVLLQGPRRTSPGDTAFFLGQRRPGYTSLRMAAFPLVSKSASILPEPRQSLEWYNSVRGHLAGSGDALANPVTGQATSFAFTGDPVTASGWNDTQSLWPGFPPGDRRFVLSSGPFTLADGDTQEVVVAHVAAQGADRLSSISALRTAAQEIRSAFRDMFQSLPPTLTASVAYPTATEANVLLRADFRHVVPQSVSAILTDRGGSTITEVTLVDDGTHSDSIAGGAVWGASALIPRQPAPISIDLRISLQGGATQTIRGLVTGLMTIGEVVASTPVIFAENIIDDHRLNSSETIRYGVTIQNNTPFTIATLSAASENSGYCAWCGEVSSVTIENIPPNSAYVMRYDSLRPGSFFTLTADGVYGAMPIPITLADGNGNVWNNSITWIVTRPEFFPQDTVAASHISGIATGSPRVLVIDPTQLKGHTYLVQGVDSINSAGEHGITLKDATDGRVFFTNHPLPDSAGFNMPITDGFRLSKGLLGSRSGQMVYYGQTWDGSDTYDRNWAAQPPLSNPLNLEGYYGLIGNAPEHWPSGGVDPAAVHSVRVDIASTDTTGNIASYSSDVAASYGYRYVQNADKPPARPEFAPYIKNRSSGFAYQDYTLSVPFSAYDIDVQPPQRLMVGYLENNVPHGLLNGRYFPPPGWGAAFADTGLNNTIDAGPREWFFIFNVPYATTPDSRLQVDIESQHVPLMWVGYPSGSLAGHGFVPGSFSIFAAHPPGSADQWTFTLARESFLPANYALEQNYPNPFNPGTTIRYTLAWPAEVTIEVYDVLGQRVRTLKDDVQYAGKFSVKWDGTNDNGRRVASGVYFYRLQANTTIASGQSFTQVKKMLLLR